MAYGGRRPTRGPPPRRGGGGGGGGNTAGYLVAGLFVVGLVVLLIVLASGKKEPPPRAVDRTPEEAPAQPAAPPKPKEPEAPPYPPVEPKVLEDARALVRRFAEPAARANALYDDAVKAKHAGNDDLWQKKLAEADELLEPINDEWNEKVIARMPASKDYDEEQVANHWLGKEGQELTRALRNLPAIKKSLRLH